ncbi:hypothetical protein [Wolbachia endosymbiont (group A) of Cydia strobilella]
MKLSTNFVKYNKWCHSSLESRKKNGVIPVPSTDHFWSLKLQLI